MAKKTRQSPNTPIHEPVSHEYLTWDTSDQTSQAKALQQFSSNIDSYSGKVYAAHRDSYQDMGGSGISGRPGLTQSDYDLWRPDEARSRSQKGRIIQSDHAYNDIGIVKNMIDLMGDLACQGIRVSHPNKRIERFYRSWFKKVGGEGSF